MKWLFAEAHVVIVSRNTLYIILHLIRFKQVFQNGQKNFQTEPLATSSDILIPSSPNNSLISSIIQSPIGIPKSPFPAYRPRSRPIEDGQTFLGMSFLALLGITWA
jgi:hypothetical protein